MYILRYAAIFEEFADTLDPSTNSRTVWNKLKSMTGKCTGFLYPGTLYDKSTNEYVTTNKGKADTLANNFAKQSSDNNHDPDFVRHKRNINKRYRKTIAKAKTEKSIMDDDFTLTEFENFIRDRKGSAPGDDLISYTMFKHSHDKLKYLTLRLFNKVWESGNIPETWRKATVIPLLKPNNLNLNRQVTDQYR